MGPENRVAGDSPDKKKPTESVGRTKKNPRLWRGRGGAGLMTGFLINAIPHTMERPIVHHFPEDSPDAAAIG